jgi:hypothetical protein
MIRIGANIRIIPQGIYTSEELKQEFRNLGLLWTLKEVDKMDKVVTYQAEIRPESGFYCGYRFNKLSYSLVANTLKPLYQPWSCIAIISFRANKQEVKMTGLISIINRSSIKQLKKDADEARLHWLKFGG